MNYFFIAVTTAAALFAVEASSVFVEDPGPRHVISPVGSQFQLNCSVAVGHCIAWAVFVTPLNRELLSDSGFDETLLRQRGITVRELSNDHSSQLVINATTVQLVNYIECIDQDPVSGSKSRGQRVNVTIYGPPSPPTDVMLTPLTVNSVRVSWSSPPTPPGVTLYFNLTIFNINSSSSEPVLMRTDIQTLHYVFTDDMSQSRPCDVYSFQVTARNDVGIDNSSEIITGSLPSLPDISAVEDSLQHFLVKDAELNVANLTVSFDEADACPDFPVTDYTLILEDSEKYQTTSLSYEAFDILYGIMMNWTLMENRPYTYHIVVTNMMGNSTSSLRSIMTTDVQDIIITHTRGSNYSIQCSYITGSDARGCEYTLVSKVKGVENIKGAIERTNSEGIMKEVRNASCYSGEVLAKDWERDNTTGTLAVRRNVSLVGHGKCFMQTNNEGLSGGQDQTIVIVIPIVVILVVLILITVVIGIVVGYRIRNKKKSRAADISVPGQKEAFKMSPNPNPSGELTVSCETVDPLYSIPFNPTTCKSDDAANGSVTGTYSELNLSPNRNPSGEITDDPDPMYSTLSNSVTCKSDNAANGSATGTHSELNSDHVYHILEKPDLVASPNRRRISHDPTAPPVPDYCPSGGDSPAPSPEPVKEGHAEYAEVIPPSKRQKQDHTLS